MQGVFPARITLVVAGFFLTFVLVVETWLVVSAETREREARQSLQLRGTDLRAQLLSELEQTIYLANGLVSFVQASGGAVIEGVLDPWMNALVSESEYIRNIGLAPENRLTYIYPVQGNEAAIGLYYPDNKAQWPVVQQIILKARPALSPPVKLLQGGTGLIYRIPVYLEESGYWGLVSTVMNGDAFFDYLRRRAESLNLHVALDYPAVGGTYEEAVRFGEINRQSDFMMNLAFPGANWRLWVASPVASASEAAAQRLFGWLVALGASAFLFLVMSLQQSHARVLAVTEQAEMRFDLAFEQAPIGMCIINQQQQVQSVNATLMALVGLDRKEVLGNDFAELVWQEDRALVEQKIASFLEGRGGLLVWETRLKEAEGEPVDCLCHLAEVPEPDPRRRTLILQLQDVREQKRLDRMKAQFVSTVSHELRTPITAISGSLAMARHQISQEADPQVLSTLIDMAARNSKRLNMLINDLLDVERITSGNLKLSPQKIRPGQAVEQCLDALSPYAAQFEIRLVSAVQPGLPSIEVDPDRLQQILSNFLSNAIKFSPKNHPVMLQALLHDDWVRFAVVDQGPGIPDEFRNRIFQRFSQADGSDTRAKGGTGLGLAICKELAEHMSARTGFESEPGVRTEFFIEFAAAGTSL